MRHGISPRLPRVSVIVLALGSLVVLIAVSLILTISDQVNMLHGQGNRKQARETSTSLSQMQNQNKESVGRLVPKAQGDRPVAMPQDEAAEAAEFYRLKRAPNGEGPIPVERYMIANEHTKQMMQYSTPLDQVLPSENSVGITALDALSTWTSLGPGNIGGRTRAIVIDQSSPNTMYAGGVAGGVWKTTNGGASWTALNDFMANLAVATLAIDPGNSNVIYAGTGEGFGNIDAVRGAGVFKTTNGGTNWIQLSATSNSNWYYVNRISINPTNGQILLAATNTGIWRSTDGGTSWSNRFSTRMLDIDFNPTDGSQCISSGTSGAGARYSTDGGLTWTAASGLPTTGRIETAYSRSNPSIVYASVDNNEGEVYRSTDGGHSFTVRSTGLHYFNAGSGNQGWYDNIIWVDPTNSNIVIIGGEDLWRSTDGGANFTDIGGYTGGAHPDQHIIVHSPLFDGSTNRTVFFGNDGGIYRADNVYTVSSAAGWTKLNNNLGITQFYDGAPYPSGTTYFGGTQDNGTNRGTDAGGPNAWTAILGGDGGYVAIDPSNTNNLYAEYYWLSIQRSTNGGSSFSSAISGITEPSSNFLFINPFVMDPSNSQRLWTGGRVMWRTSNGAGSWSQASATLCGAGSISAIAVSSSNPNNVLAGTESGCINRTSVGVTSTSSTVWSSATPRSGYVSGLAFDPINGNVGYATYSSFNSFSTDKHVYKSTDSGATWTGIDGSGINSIPDIPVHAIVVDPTNSSRLYIGTDLGVFTTTDGGVNWMQENTGFANVVVESLKMASVNGVNALFAFTHGRGAWRASSSAGSTRILTIASSNPNSGVSITVSPNDINNQGTGTTQFSRTYNTNATVSLTAPATVSGNNFQKWQRDGVELTMSTSTSVTMDTNHTMTAVYTTGTPTQTELVTNGSFSSGSPATGWVLSGNFYADSRFTNCRSCPGYAYVSNSDGTAGNNLSGNMYQAVIVPSNATSATVSFWYYITTQETTTSTAYDVLNVTLQNSSGGFLSTVAILSNLDKSTGYIQKSVNFDLTPYRGQTIRINFLATTDPTLPTVFRVDDVSIVATLASNNVQVTVQPNPSGRAFSVDGTSYSIAQTFTWLAGSNHAISTNSPQSGGTGTQYVWSNWSDGGAISHTISPSTNATYTANFVTQYFLTMNAGTGGTVSPPSNWYNNGTAVNISAIANSGYTFSSWSGSGTGSFSGTTNPASVTMNSAITETANFVAIVTRTLTVASSNPSSGVSITVTPADNNGSGNGSTQFTRTYNNNTSVNLTAPATASGNNFQKWQRDGSDWSTSQATSVTMDANHTMTAIYTAPVVTRTLTVASSNPSSGVSITVTPADNNGSGNGSTQFTRTYNNNTSVNLTAPATASGNNFQKWQRDGSDWSTSQGTSVTMDGNHTMTAFYTTPVATRTLTVASSNPSSGVSITVTPTDNSGSGNGTTQFTRTYNNNTSVNLTAPATASGNNFQKWQRDGSDWSTSQATSVTMDGNHTLTAVYITPVVTRTLTVASSNPSSGVSITVTPTDNNGTGNGTTQFTRTYNNNTTVNLTAPATASGNNFQKWQRDGSDWSTSQATSVTMDGNHTMTGVYVTPSSATASYDSVLKAAKCGQIGGGCDSGTLLNGRGTIVNGVELNQPNTIYSSCPDSSVGTYHSDESIDKIKITTIDGTNFGPGKLVRVDVTVWAFSTTQDYLDLFYASDAANPNWQLVKDSLVPSATGLQTLSATFTLPTGTSLQAIRANFSYDGPLTSCGTTGTDYVDHDDLIFAVSSVGQTFQLAMEQFGPVGNQALAMDAMSMLRDPFPVVTSNLLNKGTDKNTRVMIYLTNLQLGVGETAASVVVNLLDSSGHSFDVAAEDVRPIPNSVFTQVTFRLPVSLTGGTCTVFVKAHGQSGNAGTFRVQTSGP